LTTHTHARVTEPNQSLLGHYSQKTTRTSNECFDTCDNDAKCAAASFDPPNICRFHKFGFEQVKDSIGSTSYIIPVVRDEMANIDKLGDTFQIVKPFTRLLVDYKHFDTLTPSECFEACTSSSKCGGATFTVDSSSPFNCYLCPVGSCTERNQKNAKGVDVSLCTAFVKTADVAAAVVSVRLIVNFH
jgi:hypothetical protein